MARFIPLLLCVFCLLTIAPGEANAWQDNRPADGLQLRYFQAMHSDVEKIEPLSRQELENIGKIKKDETSIWHTISVAIGEAWDATVKNITRAAGPESTKTADPSW